MKSIFWILSALLAFATAASAQTRSTVTLTVAQSTVNEGQGGAGVLVVRRSQATENSLRVFYGLSGSARHGVDYARLSGVVEIPAGGQEATIEIVPLDDNRREPTERVVVQLRPARNGRQYRLSVRRATVIILDDDQPAGTPRPPVARSRGPWTPVPGPLTNPTNAPAPVIPPLVP